jgi:hypothetical protein
LVGKKIATEIMYGRGYSKSGALASDYAQALDLVGGAE